jgi:hypothetical protein
MTHFAGVVLQQVVFRCSLTLVQVVEFTIVLGTVGVAITTTTTRRTFVVSYGHGLFFF